MFFFVFLFFGGGRPYVKVLMNNDGFVQIKILVFFILTTSQLLHHKPI